MTARFAPSTRAWFEAAFAEATPAQTGAWEAISRGEHTLVVAPTGSGKALAAFLPDFVPLGPIADRCLNVKIPILDTCCFHYRLAWNPRLLRLNPHARHRKDKLVKALYQKLAASPNLPLVIARRCSHTGFRK